MEKKIVNNYGSFDVVMSKGKGSTLWDVNGKKYIDFIAGIGVNCLGHNYKPLVKAIPTIICLMLELILQKTFLR